MTTSVAAETGRTVDRVAALSAVGHVVIIGLGVFAAADMGGDAVSRAFWLLALFAALGLLATVLAWVSVRTGRIAWYAGIALLLVSLVVIVYAATIDGAAAMVVLGGGLLFTDWLLFANAHKAIEGCPVSGHPSVDRSAPTPSKPPGGGGGI